MSVDIDHTRSMYPKTGDDSFDTARGKYAVIIHFFVLTALLFGLIWISRLNYLLFHSLSELFSIAVACAVFLVVWNSRRFTGGNALLILGIAYLFVAGIDLMHTLSYKGMGVFAGNEEANPPTQL